MRSVTRRVACSVFLASSLALGGCAASGEPWTYSTSRAVYGSVDHGRTWASGSGENMNPGAVCGYVVLLCLPFALDTLLLPITIPHDLGYVH